MHPGFVFLVGFLSKKENMMTALSLNHDIHALSLTRSEGSNLYVCFSYSVIVYGCISAQDRLFKSSYFVLNK